MRAAACGGEIAQHVRCQRAPRRIVQGRRTRSCKLPDVVHGLVHGRPVPSWARAARAAYSQVYRLLAMDVVHSAVDLQPSHSQRLFLQA